MSDVTLTLRSEDEVINALPGSGIITNWQTSMKTVGQTHINEPPAAAVGKSIFDNERSVLYYDGSEVFYQQYLYWNGVDQTYADACLVLSDYLWAQYISVYGALGATQVEPRYKTRSQWIFPQAAQRKSFPHVEDMATWSSYASYLDGHTDAYADSDTRGLGYLIDAYETYRAETGNDVDRFSSNRNADLADLIEQYSRNLGPTDGKTKELFYMLGILCNAIMRHRHQLSRFWRPYQIVDRMLEYIVEYVEPINDYRIRYGTGFIDDGAGGNEALVYYPGLEMIIAPAFRWHKKYQEYADGMFEYAVNNVDLNLDKDYVQQYRWSMEYINR